MQKLNYPSLEASLSSYRINSPIRPKTMANSIIVSKPLIKEFQELYFNEMLRYHGIYLQGDDFSQFLSKEEEKLLSVTKFPDDIFLTGYCFWFDNNFKLNGISKQSLEIYFNKMRKNAELVNFANDLCMRGTKYNFDDRFLKALTNFFEFNHDGASFHQKFYESLNGNYMQMLYSTYMRICSYYVLQRINDCFLLKDPKIIMDCKKNCSHFTNYFADFKCKSFFNDEYRVILNLICESIAIKLKLLTINKLTREFMKESFPTNLNKSFQQYQQILTLKFVIIIDNNNNSAVYRAYRKPNYKNQKYCLECQASLETKIKSNLKSVCFDCFNQKYCSMNKEKLDQNFYESKCRHRYCITCLIFIFNTNERQAQIKCSALNCAKTISMFEIENFLKLQMADKKKKGEIDEIQCPNCKKNAIISKNEKNKYVFCCKICNKSSCLLHKCLIERCLCYCPKCKKQYSSTYQEVGQAGHIELMECLECKTIICKTCKENLKTYDGFCSCKCFLCFNLRLKEDEKDSNCRCRSCLNICNTCFIKTSNINYCEKCRMGMCRVCINEAAANEKYQFFLKKNFCLFCDAKKK